MALRERAVRETALPERAVRETALPETALPETALRETASRRRAGDRPSGPRLGEAVASTLRVVIDVAEAALRRTPPSDRRVDLIRRGDRWSRTSRRPLR